MADTTTVEEVTEKLASSTLTPEASKLDDTTKGNGSDEAKTEETTPSGDVSSDPTKTANEIPTQTEDVTTSGQPEKKEAEEDRTNLIINYLPPTMSEGTLATLFSPYGLLERCKIVVDLQTLRSRGYGFVKYDNQNSAERAMKALNGYELNGKKLKVAFARQQCKAITNANLYITNIPSHFENENLYKLFQDYGKIIECRVLKDQNGQSRGVGFVRMDTHHNAIQALQAMDQYVIDDKHPPLLVKLAQRRVPRRYWNNQNRNQGIGQNNRGQGGRGNRGGRGRGKQNRRQYQQKTNRQQQQYGQMPSAMTGMGQDLGGPMASMGGSMGGNMGAKRGMTANRGYYRPRQQQRMGGNQQKQQYQPRRNPSQGGQPYYPAAMYDAPFAAMAPQYPQAAYPQNMHMPMNQPQNPANPSGVPGMLTVHGDGVNVGYPLAAATNSPQQYHRGQHSAAYFSEMGGAHSIGAI